MDLDRTAREYVTWPLTGLPEDYTSGFEVSIDNRATWHPVDVINGAARALLAGPDATSNPPAAIVFPAAGTYRPALRLVDTPETILRPGGTINVI